MTMPEDDDRDALGELAAYELTVERALWEAELASDAAALAEYDSWNAALNSTRHE